MPGNMSFENIFDFNLCFQETISNILIVVLHSVVLHTAPPKKEISHGRFLGHRVQNMVDEVRYSCGHPSVLNRQFTSTVHS